jgi:hypothetical protein
MASRSNFYGTVITPTIWVIGVVSICLFTHHKLAIFVNGGPQSAALSVKKPS